MIPDHINAAYQRWKDGEPNDTFDRLIKTAAAVDAGTAKTVDLTHLTREEYMARLVKLYG